MMTQLRLLIDGSGAPADAPLDRACQFGDGLFETIAIRDGRPALFARHMRRLHLGCTRLRLDPPDPGLLYREAIGLAAGVAHGYLKIIWSAGRSAQGYRRAPGAPPIRYLACAQTAPGAPVPPSLRLCRTRLGNNPTLAGIKHLNRLEQVLASAEWAGDEAVEGLVSDQDGMLVEATASNLFVEIDGHLYTPPIRHCGVAGIVRELALEIGLAQGMPVTEQALAPEALQTASAAYLSNSLQGVRRAAGYADTRYRPEPPWHPVMAATAAAAFDTASGDAA